MIASIKAFVNSHLPIIGHSRKNICPCLFSSLSSVRAALTALCITRLASASSCPGPASGIVRRSLNYDKVKSAVLYQRYFYKVKSAVLDVVQRSHYYP